MKTAFTMRSLALMALFVAIGLVLPFLTGQIPQIGIMLSPLHYPVFLCAFICGKRKGALIGFILPLLRGLFFGMPPLYPMGLAMAVELATYGFLAGFIFEKSPWNCLIALYKALIVAIIGGRLVWGLAMLALLALTGQPFTWTAFVSGAIISTIPGTLLQLIVIPALVLALDKAKLPKFK